MKVRIIALIVVLCSTCTVAYSFDIPKLKIPEKIAEALNKDKQETTKKQQTVKTGDTECFFSETKESLTFTEKTLAVVKRKLISRAFKSLDLGDGVELPEKIQNTCEAEKRYAYIVKFNNFWAKSTLASIEKAKKALDIDYEIEAARLFQNGDKLSDLSESQIVTFKDDMGEVMEKIEEKIVSKKVVNKDLLLESFASMRASVTQAFVLGGWDKRMGEFMEENMKWTLSDLKRVKVFVDYVKLLGGTLQSMQKISEAYIAYNEDGVESKKYKSIIARAEKQHLAHEKQLAKELEL